ncbi:hypothetical protein AB0912_15430 [Streptomyces sp. NPDC007084]|uniref:hypothetical protein n=1 Tax=Streptomyces sp. NPDC007084 TaxID=3154313 RepID=UPI00345265B0
MSIYHPDIPLGHSIPTHQTFGWCSHCPGRTLAEELAAWQTRELSRLADAVSGPGRADGEPRSYAERVNAPLSESTITALNQRLRAGDTPRRRVGRRADGEAQQDETQAEAIARVRNLHRPASDWSWKPLGCQHDGAHTAPCRGCRGKCWPCPTIRAIDGEQPAAVSQPDGEA